MTKEKKNGEIMDITVLWELREEAAEHGDLKQVAIVDRALDGDEEAIAECQRVVDDAAAQW